MKLSRKWFFIFTGFVFVTAFQNCSLHQSPGRKFVEDGSAKIAKDASGQSASFSSTKISGAGCEPYIDSASASEAMGSFATTKMMLDQDSQTPTCVVSANEPSLAPELDVVACSISANNLELLQNAPDQTMVLDPYGPLSRGSLGYSRKLSNGAVQFIFVGSSDSALEAVACQLVFDNEEHYLAHSDEAIEKASRLVHAIYQNLR